MKSFVKTLLYNSGILKPLKMLNHNKIVILNYHRIRDLLKPVMFDEDVYGPTAERFYQEMRWLKKETRILSEEELIEIVYSKKPVDELCSMVTFDDGYRDNFDIAYPILRELKIPGMFFIPTGHLSDRTVGWWDLVAYLLKNTSKSEFVFRNKQYAFSDPKSLIRRFNSELKEIDSDKVDGFIFDLALALDQPLPTQDLQSAELMTWEQVKTMSENGMTIGTHSHDHSILSKQDSLTLKCQLATSIEILEGRLDKKIRSIAYPVGGYDHFNDDTKKVSQCLGLELGFSYLTGFNKGSNIDPFNVKRTDIRPYWNNLDIPLAFPNHYFKSEYSK